MRKTFIKTVQEMRTPFIVLITVWLIYGVLSILAPAAQATTRYGISLFWTNILRLTILLPYLFIWLAALFSILRFTKYLKLISYRAPEYDGFKIITKGLWMLLAVVVIPSFIGLISAYYPDSVSVQKTITILRNDITVIFYLAAFYFLWRGSGKLSVALIKEKIKDKSVYVFSLLLTALLSIGFVWFVINNPYRTFSDVPTIRPTYFLTDISIFLTIIIPYVVIWLLGLLTIFNFRSLSRKISGIIYKNSFNLISRGIIIIISLLIALQFLSQASTYLSQASLAVILIIIYLILFAVAAGYLYIAYGAKELALIEEA